MIRRPEQLAAARRRLASRCRKQRSLVNFDTHPYVVDRIDATYGAFAVCDELLPELVTDGLAHLARTRELPSATLPALQRYLAIRATELHDAAFALMLWNLLDAADLVSRSRDTEALKLLSWETIKVASKWATKALPVRYEDLRDLLDLLGNLDELFSVSKASRVRRRQVKDASLILAWLEALEILATSWCLETLRLLAIAQRRPRADDDTLLQEFARRSRVHRQVVEKPRQRRT